MPERAARSVPFVVPCEPGQHNAGVAFTSDEDPVGALAAYRAHPAFGVRVRPGRLRWRADHPDAGGGEHRVERGGERGVAVTRQEPKPVRMMVEVHQHVAGLRGNPGAGRVGGGR